MHVAERPLVNQQFIDDPGSGSSGPLTVCDTVASRNRTVAPGPFLSSPFAIVQLDERGRVLV